MSAGKFMKQAAERDYSQWWQKPGTFPWMFQQEKPPLPKRVIGIKENYERCIRGQEPYWMPATKRFCDFVKGQGKFLELHS